MTNHLPTATVDLSKVDLTTTGLYGELSRLGLHLRVAPPTDRRPRCCAMSRTAFNDAGVAIEHG